MSIDATLERIDRLSETIARFENLIDKIPRLLEMFGVAFFAGKASENIGADFQTGAIGGIVADGLAHSNLPHNQIGGLALGTYFASIGLLNVIPFGIEELPPLIPDFEKIREEWTIPPELQYKIKLMLYNDCIRTGGKIVKEGPHGIVWCELPVVPVLGGSGPHPEGPHRGGGPRGPGSQP